MKQPAYFRIKYSVSICLYAYVCANTTIKISTVLPTNICLTNLSKSVCTIVHLSESIAILLRKAHMSGNFLSNAMYIHLPNTVPLKI
jgi:hypothetical protein